MKQLFYSAFRYMHSILKNECINEFYNLSKNTIIISKYCQQMPVNVCFKALAMHPID